MDNNLKEWLKNWAWDAIRICVMDGILYMSEKLSDIPSSEIVHLLVLAAIYYVLSDKLVRFIVIHINNMWKAKYYMECKVPLIYDDIIPSEGSVWIRKRKTGHIRKVGFMKVKFDLEDGTEKYIQAKELLRLNNKHPKAMNHI